MGLSEEVDDDQYAPEKPIRILFISHGGGLEGAQKTLLTLLSAIDRRVCSPLLVVPNDGSLSRAVGELGIPAFVERFVHWIPASCEWTRMQRLRYLYDFFRTLDLRCRAIEKLIAEHEIDLVYTNAVTCVEGAIAAQRTKKPHVWHIHEHILRNSDLARLLPYKLYCAVVGYLSKSIIFCSKALARGYPKLSGKAFIVYNGLPLPSLCDRRAARAEVASELGIDVDAKLVAVVGALNPGKDHNTFLTAAEQVARRVEDAVFLIVGAGPEEYTNMIRQRIRDLQLDSRVRLLGWRDDIHHLMAAIDVLVISSEQESFGLTAIEALSMETPVVATRCGGPEEILEDGVTGLLVPVKDPGALADATVRLLLEPMLARRIGVRGRNHISDKFNVDRYVQGIQRVILDAVASQSNNKSHVNALKAPKTGCVQDAAFPKDGSWGKG